MRREGGGGRERRKFRTAYCWEKILKPEKPWQFII